MSTVFVATPDGRQAQLPRVDFERLWRDQSLGEQAHYWMEGMEAWKPATEYKPLIPMLAPSQPGQRVFQPEPAVAPVAEQSAPAPVAAVAVAEEPAAGESAAAMKLRLAENKHFTEREQKLVSAELWKPREVVPMTYAKDPRRLTKGLIGLIYLELALEIVAFIGNLVYYLMLGRVEEALLIAVALAQFVLALAFIGLAVVTAVIFLMWVHRMKRNCEAFGAMHLRYSPGWAVGWFFIPFANIYKPFDCMRETWQASTSPKTWMTVEPGNIVTAWWILWLAAGVLGQVAFYAGRNAADLAGMQTEALINLGCGVVSMAMYLVTIKMILEIYRRQKYLVDNKEPMDLSPVGNPYALTYGLKGLK